MRTAVIDYRKVRLSNITSPQYRHLLLLLGWVVYFGLYFLTENLIPEEKCHDVSCALDYIIPFNEWFVIPYTIWFAYIVISQAATFFLDVSAFRRSYGVGART